MKSISRQGVGLAGLRALAVVALCLAAAMWAAPAFAADGTWTGTTGNWSVSDTWSGGTIADGTDFTAFFTGVDIAADQTITLDEARVIGNIIFTDDTTATNNLTISGAKTLTLDVATGTPTLEVTQSGRTLTIDSLIAGNLGLTKSGAGTLILSGVNTYSGATTISAGELVATTGATFTPFGTGTVDIGANILTLSPSSTAAHSTLTNTLIGTGTLNINPAAGRNMTLSGTLSGFTGTINVAANTSPAKLATGTVTLGSGAIVNIASGATWSMNGGTHSGITANIYGTGNGESLGALRMDGGTIANTSSVVLKANGSVGGNSGTGTINAVISDGGVGYSLTKMGAGTTVLGGSNTYTGATIINKGTLSLANVSALSTTSAITMAGGTTLTKGTGGVFDSAVINAPITVGNSGTTATIALNAKHSSGGTSAATLTLNGAIGGAGNVTFSSIQTNNAYSTVILNQQSTYAGTTLITCTGTNTQIFVNLGIDDALPTTTVLTLDGQNGDGSGRNAQLNLNGHDQTLAGLTNIPRDSLRTQSVKNTSGTAATLTINDSGTRTFSGKLGTGGTNFGLTKSGSGTWTISGANTYTGATKITAGILSLGNTNSMQNSALDTANSITGDASNGLRTTVTSLTMGGLTGDKNLADVFTTTTGGYTGLTALTLNPGTGVTNSYSADVGNGNGSMTLTKIGLGTQVLSGTNTYTGATAISAGTLQFAKQASLYNNNTIGGGWTAANIKVASTGTLALHVGGTDEFTTADVTTLLTALGGANGSSTTGFAAGSFIGFDTTNASGGTFTVADAIADSTGAGGGAIGVTKLGANTLVLSGLSATPASNYSGTTTIGQGTLAFTTTNPSLTGGLTFGATAANTTPGILDLTTINATFGGAMTVNTNSATASEIKIGSGQTLTINNNVQIGATTPAVADTVTKLAMTGGGVFNANTPAAGTFIVGGSTSGSFSQFATLDLTALSAATINTGTTGTLRVGTNTGTNIGGQGKLLLPTPAVADTVATTTLTAGTIGVGVNGSYYDSTMMNTITLGTGLTQLNADNINVGTGGRDLGQIIYGQADGDLIIRAADGSSRATAINVGSLGGGTVSSGNTILVDFSGHDADILVDKLNVGNQARTSTQSYGFKFGAGNNSLASKLDANSVNIGFYPGASSNTQTRTSKVNLSGGTVTFGNVGATGTGVDIGSSLYTNGGAAPTVGELNISGGNVTIYNSTSLGAAVRLGTNVEAGGGTVTASMNLTGGTTTLGGDIIRNATSPRTTSTVKLSGGTLDMGGNDIGTATELITLTAESGTLQNVATINGTGGLTKTTTGTLVLTGTNAYTGGTTVNAGTLLLSGAFNMPTTGTLQVNAGGNFSLADGTALATTTTAALGLASGAVLSFDWNADSVDTLTSTAAATTAGTVGIIINNTSPTGSGGTLISSASGGLTTANGTQYFLANNTNYAATLTVTDIAVSIGAQSSPTALTNAYWKGGQVTGALGAMALSSGTSSNWATDAAGTSAAGVVPGGSAVNVIFGATGATEQANVTTGADMNLGSITFNDSAAVTIGGSNTITLNSTSATAATSSGSGTTVTPGSAITVTSYANAANTINANIQLAAGQTWNIASTKTLTVGGSVGGTGALTLADAGTLILTGANAYTGATAVSAGTLQLGDGTTGKDGTIGNTSGVTNNAALVFNRFGSSSAGYAISGTGTVTKLGAGTQALSGTNNYIGATTISAGTLQFAKEVSLYNNNTAGTGWTAANIVVGNSGTLALNVGGTGEFTTVDVTTLLTNLGGANGTSTAGFATGSKIAFDTTGGNFTVADLIADSSGGGGGAIGLTKLGTNALTLTNANTYTGVTTISAGTLALNVNTATLGTAAAGTVVQSGAALKLTTASMTLNEALTLSGTGVGTTQGSFGALLLNVNSGAFTLARPITLSGGAAINSYAAGTTTIQIAQGIGGTGDLTLRASASSNGGALYRLQGQSTYDGATILSTNETNAMGITVQNEIENALPTTTVLKLQASAISQPTTLGQYKLNGFNQTVAGIEGTVGANALNAIVGGSATLSTLTVNNSGNYTFAGKLGNTGTNENNLALVKSGIGTLTLTAANTYTGDTKVEAGTLSITNAYLADLADVYLTTGAHFDLNFSGDPDVIDELFFNNVAQVSGTWGSKTSTAVHKSDLFTGNGLLLITTSGLLPGDTNGDFVVDAADFITLKKNFGRTDAADAQNGNFTTPDTNVNWADLGILMNNMGTGGGTPATAPEPCSAMLLIFGAAALLRRRRA